MLRHIVMFSFKSDVSGERKKSILEETRELGRIPGVENLIVAENIEEESDYEYLLCLDVAGLVGLKAYQAHEEHVKFAEEKFRPLISRLMAADFEYHKE